MNKNTELLFFYGTECPHCIIMDKLLDKLETEESIAVERKETWHNEENNKLLEKLDCGDNPCGGVPFFINQKTGKTLCGEVSYKEIKSWAKGE